MKVHFKLVCLLSLFSFCKVDNEAEQPIAKVDYSFSGCYASRNSKLIIYKKKKKCLQKWMKMEKN